MSAAGTSNSNCLPVRKSFARAGHAAANALKYISRAKNSLHVSHSTSFVSSKATPLKRFTRIHFLLQTVLSGAKSNPIQAHTPIPPYSLFFFRLGVLCERGQKAVRKSLQFKTCSAQHIKIPSRDLSREIGATEMSLNFGLRNSRTPV